ncbi:Poly(A)+ RNA export protein [Rhizoctonia solani AG-1 IA]|uniref:Poly(A)+ RNA export protein n=1 Tax=Thanatephorus cucumeris (strain AG1-IA) TaxID=983506 RepID=L8WQP0_THACA|nr:Poly(A)+ RNA export protein [Rhizoctonia solani AG-1 IA]
MAFFGGSTSTTTAATDAKDVELVDPPGDSISCLDFSPTADYLAVGSWNNEVSIETTLARVRLYEIGVQGQSQGKAMFTHEGPVLSVCWNKEGNKVFSGGADKAGRMFDVQTGQATQIAVHDAPIKCVKWIDAQGGILATGSWDKTLKYWDTRQSTPVAKVDLPDRCYTMDVTYPLLVVGTAERHIQMFNLNNPTTAYRWQTRVISCFTTANGFAVGSIEGRVAIHPAALNISVGRCGWYNQLLGQGFENAIENFRPSARTDLLKGHSGMTSDHPNKVMLHVTKDEEIKVCGPRSQLLNEFQRIVSVR